MSEKENLYKLQGLKPFNSVIQKCKACGKLDAYAGDNHQCNPEYQEQRRQNFEHYFD